MPDPGLSDTLPMPTDTEYDSAAMEMFFCGKSAGRPREADKEARAENLLYTAGCLFLEKGYGKVSLEMIARQAHVAVRTIYVKFGGKSGLFNAVVEQRRDAYFSTMPALETDMRPLPAILGEFGMLFLQLITMPAAVRLNRMVVAEAASHPELAETFHKVGPGRTRDMLTRFFSRPEIAIQFRAKLTPEQLAIHLLNCLLDDQMSRLLFPPLTQPDPAQLRKLLDHRLDLFLRATLRAPLAA
ncbi:MULTISPECIES: TetR/AcrR family transcriptional regulator [unclassified Janthinobacterium]|uniref:TetR/AcrR family transcriptional regulator n=1 Tax=unclassified Janthinobacterium TaxID=2610881 RepID=UPI00160B7ABD|nr:MULTISPECIES: TetR/AcrR family transcriptional regulator [unclassified Janthinobacterium]MBB5607895.1 AcrR family transcriptional regulator [Janthinobacterium sp. S3T4]MBB5613364.1 AcrR family transcriptional regulator [Janthinobacterium sp. S3M3]